MPSRAFYLQQARILLEMAARMSAKQDAAELIARANEYQMLAEAMPDDGPPPTAPGMVPQPMQQQQQQKKPQDESK